jgi:hypothetical protein
VPVSRFCAANKLISGTLWSCKKGLGLPGSRQARFFCVPSSLTSD